MSAGAGSRQLAKLAETAARLFFPARCLVCGRVTAGELVCEGCRGHLDRCVGTRVLDVGALRREGIESLDGALCCFRYEGAAEEIVKRMKFGGERWLARDIAAVMTEVYEHEGFGEVDAVCCVPACEDDREGRLRAGLMTKTFARMSGLAPDAGLLVKVRRTKKQHLLGHDERRTNLINAFRAGRDDLGGLSALVVDDVMTTGRTLDECAAALKTAGAKRVYAAVFARPERKA